MPGSVEMSRVVRLLKELSRCVSKHEGKVGLQIFNRPPIPEFVSESIPFISGNLLGSLGCFWAQLPTIDLQIIPFNVIGFRSKEVEIGKK